LDKKWPFACIKDRPIYCTESGRFLAQKSATYLHKKQLIYCTQSGCCLALKVADSCTKAALYGTKIDCLLSKNGRFIAQKAVSLLHRKQQFYLHKGQAEFLNRKQPLSLCHFMATGHHPGYAGPFCSFNCTYEMLTAFLWLSMELDVSSCYYQNEKMCIEQSGTKVWEL